MIDIKQEIFFSLTSLLLYPVNFPFLSISHRLVTFLIVYTVYRIPSCCCYYYLYQKFIAYTHIQNAWKWDKSEWSPKVFAEVSDVETIMKNHQELSFK